MFVSPISVFLVGSTLFPYHKQHDRFLMRLAIFIVFYFMLGMGFLCFMGSGIDSERKGGSVEIYVVKWSSGRRYERFA